MSSPLWPITNNCVIVAVFYICHRNLQMHLLSLLGNHKLRKICPSPQITLFKRMEWVSNHFIFPLNHLYNLAGRWYTATHKEIQYFPRLPSLNSSLHGWKLPPRDCQPLIVVDPFGKNLTQFPHSVKTKAKRSILCLWGGCDIAEIEGAGRRVAG